MSSLQRSNALILGASLFLGLLGLAWVAGNYALAVKDYERTVTVRGLAEHEYPADIVIWPIQFSIADNDLEALYVSIDNSTQRIREFLQENGIAANALTQSPPAITDRMAQAWGDTSEVRFRYSGTQTVTVYSSDIAAVRQVMTSMSDLGREGIVFAGADYNRQPEYLFTRLNDVKPTMIEEATKEARAAALKFADDSGSKLGKIKQASQGQFSIADRDRNNPHLKKIRVVVSVEYYLSD